MENIITATSGKSWIGYIGDITPPLPANPSITARITSTAGLEFTVTDESGHYVKDTTPAPGVPADIDEVLIPVPAVPPNAADRINIDFYPTSQVYKVKITR
jgi:hypothetical protein